MRYKHQINDREVLKLLRDRVYVVDTDAGIVYGRRGLPLRPFRHNKNPAGYFVIIFNKNKRRGISLAKLVWMAYTGRVVPRGFEVHHDDKDLSNNTWPNLFCLYCDDHRKLHGSLYDLGETVPF